MNPIIRTSTWAGRLALAAALLSACSGASPEKLMASAEAYLAKGDARAAVIELKSALQEQPDSAKLRFLLGKALLANGESSLAEIELRKALELKEPLLTVAPELARALLERGKHKELIDEFGSLALDDKQALASLKTSIGWAHVRSGQAALGDAAFKQALEAAPGFVPALVGAARQQAGRGDHDGAAKVVDEIIARGKADPDTWVLKGDLQAFAHLDREGAIAAYSKALALDPGHQGANASMVSQHLQARDAKAAGEQVTKWLAARPGNAMAHYFRAVTAYEQRDFKTAKELVQQLLRGAPDNPQLNQLAGAIELAAGSVVQARTHLGKAVHEAPGSVIARHLLATAHVRSGEPAKALEVLAPLLGPTSLDAQALSLAGQAHMQARDLDKAAEFFARAAKANPRDVGSQAALARTRFLKGDTQGAITELEQIAATDAGTVADLELVNEQLRRRDFQGALKAIENLDRKVPGKAMPMHLRGLALLGLADDAQARASFEKALALEAAYFPAAFSLAALDIADKKPQLAQQRFEAIIKAQPGHLRAMHALAELRARNGASKQEITDLLVEALRLNPREPSAHVSLINNQLINKQNDQALSTAQQAAAAMPDQPAILDALGRAQFASGQHVQAISTYNKILAIQPDNAQAHTRIAEINVAAKNTDAAGQSLRRALAAAPNSPVVHQRLFAFELKAGHTAEALKLARDLQKRLPDHSLGFVQEGDVQRMQKNNEAALAAYKTALGKTPPGYAATRYHATLTVAGKTAEAQKFADGWSKDHPKDVQFLSYLGAAALARQDLAAAQATYKRVIELQPNNALALNNVAVLMVKAGEPGALQLAQKANALAPNHPDIMNTLAVALAADKQIEPAIELQKKALALAPESQKMQLALARLHIQAGQKSQARTLLEPLAKLGDQFAGHAEVSALMAGL